MSSKNVVIVESPAKAKTIEGYLGKDFKVTSSFGHIRDLPKKGMSIDIEGDFEPTYEIPSDKKKRVSELKKAVKEAETVWLASDEDREGEAIAWHLVEALKLPQKKTKRIVFHEITKPAILKAIENPREVHQGLVDAQQARRILDRLVGYELSPVLWKKVRPGLSAGRVQSVAVRLIVEREAEIEAFEASSTYKVTAEFKLADDTVLPAELAKKLPDEKAARDYLEKCLDTTFSISAIEKKPGKKNPSPPFTTSTLQQAASQRMGWSPKLTMSVAQKLYEAGKITYMRTDSLNLSESAINQAGEMIAEKYGKDYHESRRFKTKSAGAQEAHEAIRPTDFGTFEAGNDDREQKLYRLIWQRATASQMAPAQIEKTTVKIQPQAEVDPLLAKGETVVFAGFLLAYGDAKEVLLPPLNEGDKIDLIELLASETFNRPPARYTEASLVKQLEEMGIGRPSTYAPTISTIQDREYVFKGDVEGEEREYKVLSLRDNKVDEKTDTEMAGKDSNKLIPTDIGKVVTDFLVKHFQHVIDYDFTKNMEESFDHIEDGKKQWQKVISDFYGPFHKTVEAGENVSRAEASQAREVGKDPKSGKPLLARFGRYGPMLQIGTVEDEEKPQFASMPPGEKIETITLEAALKAFDLPRVVGKTEDGEEITANNGRFGPYVKVGSTFVSIKPESPFDITEEKARELIAAKKQADAEKYINRFDDNIDVLKGRFGPYITDGKKNAKIPKETDPKDITYEMAKELLEKAPAKGRSYRGRRKKKS